MSSIKNDVKIVMYVVFAIILILIVVATLFFGCSGNSEPIKSAFSLMGNYVGAIATLAAAYIASMLYSDWKKPHQANFYSDYCKKVIESYFQILAYQQKLMVLESMIKPLIFETDKDKKIHPNFLSSSSKKELVTLNNDVLKTVDAIYLELDFFYKNINTLAGLSNDTDMLFMDIDMRSHFYKLYVKLRGLIPNGEPYYIYNNLIIVTKDKYLILNMDKMLFKLKNLSGLD